MYVLSTFISRSSLNALRAPAQSIPRARRVPRLLLPLTCAHWHLCIRSHSVLALEFHIKNDYKAINVAMAIIYL